MADPTTGDLFRAESAKNRLPLYLIGAGFLILIAAEAWMRLT